MASLSYVQQLSKVIVAQLTQTIGWNSIQTTPLELLSDILHKYLEELTRQTQRYAELYGRIEPNLDDVALAFNDLNIQIPDLEEYVSNVDPVPCIINVPKFPAPKESNLNFLKPGSKEVVTRPVHIHEHLPPIHPHEEPQPQPQPKEVESQNSDNTAVANNASYFETCITTNHISTKTPIDDAINILDLNSNLQEEEAITDIGYTAVVEHNSSELFEDENTFKKPFDSIPSAPPVPKVQNVKTSSVNENGTINGAPPNAIIRPTREIISCIMTTSGFISPAREGKLPEARKPIKIAEDPPSPIAEPIASAPVTEVNERKLHLKAENKDTAATAPAKVDNSYDSRKDIETKLYEVVSSEKLSEPNVKKKSKQHMDTGKIKELKKAKKNLIGTDPELNKRLKAFKKLLAKTAKLKQSEQNAILSRDDMDPELALALKMQQQSRSRKRKKLKMLQQQQGSEQQQLDAGPPAKQRKKKMSKTDLAANRAFVNGRPQEQIHINAHTDPAQVNPAAHSSMRDWPATNEFVHNQQLDKLSNEPDKRKLNIFKKISSMASHDDATPPSGRKSNKVTELNPPERPPPLFSKEVTPQEHLNHSLPFNANDNFSNAQNYNQDLLVPTSEVSKKKQKNPNKPPKPPKEKKIKKDPSQKKVRQPKQPKEVETPIIPSLPPRPQQPYLFPPTFLDPVGFSGPGLIPCNPLFPTVPFDLQGNREQMPNNPFSVLPNFNFMNLARFKRPNFNDSSSMGESYPNIDNRHSTGGMNEEPLDKSIKPLCNVAPLVPPSLLNLEELSSKQHSRENAFNASKESNFGYDPVIPSKDYQGHAAKVNPPITHNEPYSEIEQRKKQLTKQAPGDNVKLYEAHIVEPTQAPIVIDSDDDLPPIATTSHIPKESFSAADSSLTSEIKVKKIKDKSSGHSKKDKKDKELGVVKLKKKKDKKDKSKSKTLKHLNRDEDHSKSFKDKSLLKKEKREKKREKDRSAMMAGEMEVLTANAASTSAIFNKHIQPGMVHDAFSKEQTGYVKSTSDLADISADVSAVESSAIPKLTLKLAPSSASPISRPSTPDFQSSQRKSSKSWKKKKQWRHDDEGERSASDLDDSPSSFGASLSKINSYSAKREPSPELARISALITRPPKQKSSSKQSDASHSGSRHGVDYFEQSDLTAASVRTDQHIPSIQTPTLALHATPSGRGRPKGSTNSSSKNGKIKTPKSGSITSTIPITSLSEQAPSVANSSIVMPATQTNVLESLDPQINEDNQVWICPACGKVDDGTPMIGCDGCDAWYHWVCVGIQVPPDQDQDWYCRVCISKKQEIDKKKKRKKKDKKDH